MHACMRSPGCIQRMHSIKEYGNLYIVLPLSYIFTCLTFQSEEQITLVTKQIFTLSVFIQCSGLLQ